AYRAARTPAAQPMQDDKVPLFGARKKAQELQGEVARLKQVIDKYGLMDLVMLEAAKSGVESETEQVQLALHFAQRQLEAVTRKRTEAEAELLDLRNAVEIQEQGLYDFEHPAEDSISIGTELASLRARIKRAVKDGYAT